MMGLTSTLLLLVLVALTGATKEVTDFAALKVGAILLSV
jgi:hypothetical protein